MILLDKLRYDAGLYKNDLAVLCGMHPSTTGLILNQRLKPTAKQKAAMEAAALELGWDGKADLWGRVD